MKCLPFIWLMGLVKPAAGLAAADATHASRHGDYVVLLHGLGRSRWSMKRLEHCLSRQGYEVINVNYPSTGHAIEQLADDFLDRIVREHVTDSGRKVHFVTHSLGGIILRQYLSGHALPNLGRVVMLSPPNAGSEVADYLRRNPVFRKIVGPAMRQLGTGPQNLPRRLGPVKFELGVIAGDRSINPWFSRLIAGADDGTVAVNNCRVDGMRDFMVAHGCHTFIMLKNDVILQVMRFLRTGGFEKHDPA